MRTAVGKPVLQLAETAGTVVHLMIDEMPWSGLSGAGSWARIVSLLGPRASVWLTARLPPHLWFQAETNTTTGTTRQF